ncbi:MAG: DegT/DnrJ/EryC1/StrS family aminotransferase [Patescibacteria group bacterium]
MTIPFYKPHISKEEEDAVSRVLRTSVLSRGEETEKFEKEFAKYTKKKYAIAVNSGTSGLHLLVRIMGWKKGDEIITTPFSYIASSNVLLFENVTPVFVDIDSKTLNINPLKIEEKITLRTKGILLVHILGLPAEYEAIKKIKDKYNLRIIEDACETIGRPNNNFLVTKLGEATVYGFHENKQLTSGGEGGMIVTDDSIIAQKCWSMRNQGRSTQKDWIKHVILGFNFRMTEIQAAFGRSQLRKMDKILKRREEISNIYSSLLKDINQLAIPYHSKRNKRSWFFFFITLLNSKDRDRVCKILTEQKIGFSTNFFPPIYTFPMYAKYAQGNFPNTELISKTLLALPTFYDMKDKEVKMVVATIRSAFLK